MSTTKTPTVFEYPDGFVIHGDFGDPATLDALGRTSRFPLTFLDPCYGGSAYDDDDTPVGEEAAQHYLAWTDTIADHSLPGAACYVWGTQGRPQQRPFLSFCLQVEDTGVWQIATIIAWAKRRVWGRVATYAQAREDCVVLIKGDKSRPLQFNKQYVDTKRSYHGTRGDDGKPLLRTNVWTDVNQLFGKKLHRHQKPQKLYAIPIQAHTDPGDWIFDPMAGSGTAGVAARAAKRRFVLIEKDLDSVAVIRSRLGAGKQVPGVTL